MWTLSGFCDEISPDPREQCEVFEPHLADYNATGGFSGAELWPSAWQAFTDILTSEGIEYA
jgi:hypothetical protein